MTSTLTAEEPRRFHEWRDLPGECCIWCGDDAEVFTACDDNYVNDGDLVRCVDPACGLVGSISCDAESDPWVCWDEDLQRPWSCEEIG